MLDNTTGHRIRAGRCGLTSRPRPFQYPNSRRTSRNGPILLNKSFTGNYLAYAFGVQVAILASQIPDIAIGSLYIPCVFGTFASLEPLVRLWILDAGAPSKKRYTYSGASSIQRGPTLALLSPWVMEARSHTHRHLSKGTSDCTGAVLQGEAFMAFVVGSGHDDNPQSLT